MPKKPERILPFRHKPNARERIRAALNLGPKSSGWLVHAGIESIEEVRKLGPIEVCRRLRACGHPVSVVVAYALEGALSGCPWNAIPWETREALRVEFAQMKRSEGIDPKMKKAGNSSGDR